MEVTKLRIYTITLLQIIGWSGMFSQDLDRQIYIEQYKDMAIEEMKRSGIPASITLAQGILESNSGNGSLVRDGNNHFGIKCHDSWNGKRMYHDDDAKGECFRKYKSAYESFQDHTDFLMNSSRYDFLFDLKPDDYKGWARGLKKAGYATSPKYADALIEIIEEDRLYLFDAGAQRVPREKSAKHRNNHNTGDEFQFSLSGRRVYEQNRVEYIIAKPGDTFYNLAQELEMMPWEFIKYNELPKDVQPSDGQIVYIQPKRNKAAFGSDFHFVEEGETWYTISQKYGVKLHSLQKKNKLAAGQEPEAGDKIWLRKKNKEKVEAEEKEDIKLEKGPEFEMDTTPDEDNIDEVGD